MRVQLRRLRFYHALIVWIGLFIVPLMTSYFFVRYSFLSHGAEASPEPSAALQFDFGSVRAGTVIRHEFQIRNDSDSALRVEAVQSTCGCTVADVAHREIPPDSSVPMLAELNTAGKDGAVTQPIHVGFSDGTGRTYELRGHVVNYEFEPLRFDANLRGESPEKEVVLDWAPGVALEVERVRYNEEKLSVRAEAEEGHHRITVAIREDAPYGPISEVVQIRSNDPLVPEKELAVFGMVQYPVICEPDVLTLGMVTVGQTVEGTARFHSPYGQTFKLDSVTLVSGAPLKWTESRAGESESTLNISLTPESAQSYYKWVVRVVASAGEWTREFDLEVYGIGTTASAGA